MNRTFAVLTAVAALAATAVSAQAAKQPEVKKALFEATLEGVQRDKWDNLHQGTADPNDCDGTVASKGSEVIRFRSKTILVEATDIEGLSSPVLRKAGKSMDLYPFRLRGTVTRNGTISTSPVPRECSGTGGGYVPPRDCGTKALRGLRASADYSLARPFGRIQVSSNGEANDPFKNCPGGTQGMPHLLTQKTDNSRITSELPREELFDKKIGKLIVIGRGKRVQKGDETLDTASIRWELTLKRVKR